MKSCNRYLRYFCLVIFLISTNLLCISETSELLDQIIISLIVRSHFIEVGNEYNLDDFTIKEKKSSISYTIAVVEIKDIKNNILIIIDNLNLSIYAIYEGDVISLFNGEPSPDPWGKYPAKKEWIYEILLNEDFNLLK